jgi:hypothetical protein
MPNMYEAFDDFLRVQTWHSRHAMDEERFFQALSTVVHDPEFNPDQMGEHMDEKWHNGDFGVGEQIYEKARDHYVAAAWAVVGYLAANGLRGR